MINTQNMHGPVIGAIVGDCLGAGYEFTTNCAPPFYILPSVFDHPAGVGTDDTEQTLIVADAILEYGYTELALSAIKEGLIDWFLKDPKDVGNTTRLALDALHKEISPPKFVELSYGNGSLMRNSPISAYWYFKKTKNQTLSDLTTFVQTVSSFTHPNPQVVECCVAETVCILDSMRNVNGLVNISKYLHFETEDGTAQHALRLAYVNHIHLTYGFELYLTEIIKNGGDTDTNASIAGAIAAATIEVPAELVEQIDTKYLKYSLKNFA